MKWDRTDHPVSQAAVRVAFACLIGFGVLLLGDAMREGSRRSTAFVATACGLAGVFACSVVTYFRPRGITAVIILIGVVGLSVLLGALLAGSAMFNLPEPWATVLGVAILAVSLVMGIARARELWRRNRRGD